MEEKHLAPRVKLLCNEFDLVHNRALTTQELTGTQALVLRLLSRRGPQPTFARDLEQILHLAHPTVSGLLHRLEDKDFIRLVPEKNDKRCRRIVPTDKALATLQAIDRCFDEAEAEILTPLTPEEAAQFRTLLYKVTDSLRRRCPHPMIEPEKEVAL